MHRDDYTQKYCVFLDQGISQCRASCYLEKLLDDKKQNREENLRSSEREKDQEKISEEDSGPIKVFTELSANSFHYANTYQFDVFQFVFHPPKG
jgi:hypothetical protein